MFLNSIPVSSGPWRFDSWQKGVQLTRRKNPRFKAGPPMKLDRVVFRYILDTNARFQALKAGEGQVMEPQPQLQIADFLKDKKFVVTRRSATFLGARRHPVRSAGSPALKQPYVRKALVTGINRKQIAGALYVDDRSGACRRSKPHVQALRERTTSRTGQSTSSASRRHRIAEEEGLHRWADKPAANNSHLQLPERRQAVVPLRHHDREPAPRAGLRDHAEAAQERRHRARRSLPGGRHAVSARRFRRVTGTWSMFTWVGSPSTPITIKDLYGCGGDQNYMNYCNKPRRLTSRAENGRSRRPDGRRAQTRPSAEVHGQGHPVHPDVRTADLRHPREHGQGPVVNPTRRG